jgi:hypothetical protein
MHNKFYDARLCHTKTKCSNVHIADSSNGGQKLMSASDYNF